jgi:beta-glucosidase
MPNFSPERFLWGTATASYQIEGAVAEDGRTASIWDTFSHTPNKVEQSQTGDVACDHYHRYKEDVDLMRNLGIQAYRFSVSWSRLLPEGRGKPNQRGFDFYDRLIDELLAAGITPFVTLFHWDLPQVLQDRGGFTNRDIAGWFSEYAVETAGRLGDRVKHWIMLNEPSVFACLGHALGIHAPGIADLKSFYATTHHLNLAQGSAIQALRSNNASWRLGTTLNVHRGIPADDSNASAEMAQRHNDLWNNCFLGPLLSGGYPVRILPELTPWIRDGDLELARQPIDFLGINHYFRAHILANPKATLGFDQVPPPAHLPRTSFDWEINSDEFRDTLIWLHEQYPSPPIYITENGAYFDDSVSEDGKVHDARRIEFLGQYIHAMQEAQARGVDVRGFFVWSLLDNFEWAYGYRPTFGIVKVDFNTLRRIPKDSYYWYMNFIRRQDVPRPQIASTSR